ncbi:MAG: PGPGW domain-containing protein [Betaproteobacteria bacterium]
MFKSLQDGRPGRRFQDRYAARREVSCGALKKWSSVGAGLLVVLVGIVLLPLPGPGILVVLVGAALTATHSLFVARLLDRAELAARAALGAASARFSRRPPPPKPSPPGDASDRRTFRLQ